MDLQEYRVEECLHVGLRGSLRREKDKHRKSGVEKVDGCLKGATGNDKVGKAI